MNAVKIAAAAVLAAVSASVWAAASDQLEKFLTSVRTAEGSFSQITLDRQGKESDRPMTGEFRFQRPGRFVWKYRQPYQQEIYCDGRQLTVWDPDLMQASVKSVGSALSATPAAILFGSNDFRKEFTVRNLQRENGAEWLEALPKKKEADFSSVRIGFRDGVPASMVLQNNFGQTIELELKNVRLNAQLKASDFEFTPPKGAEVLRN